MKLHPKPFAFRCSPELREELLRRARQAGLPESEIIRTLIQRALAHSEQETRSDSDARLEKIEASVDELLLLFTNHARELELLQQQHRFGLEATLRTVRPTEKAKIKRYLSRHLPSKSVGEAG